MTATDRAEVVSLPTPFEVVLAAVNIANEGDPAPLFRANTLKACTLIEGATVGGLSPLLAQLRYTRHADELRRKVREFKETEPAPGDALRAVGVLEFIRALAAPAYAIDGLLIKGYCYAITGQSGHGKTAVALTMAVAVALGSAFAGMETERAKVLYVAGENPDDIRLRVAALLAEHEIEDRAIDGQIDFVDQGFALADRHAELMHLIQIGGYEFVFLDTDQALSSGGDENDNRERIEHAKRVRMLTKVSTRPTVVDLCHPPVNAMRTALRPRGGSAFLAEIDGNMGCWIDEGDTRVELFRTAKFRGPMFEPLIFDVKIIEGPPDAKARRMTTAIAVPASDTEKVDAVARARRREVLVDVSLHPHASPFERARRLNLPKSNVYRDIKHLLAKGAISESMDGHEITPKGKKWLTSS